jgi:hypothetical protein
LSGIAYGDGGVLEESLIEMNLTPCLAKKGRFCAYLLRFCYLKYVHFFNIHIDIPPICKYFTSYWLWLSGIAYGDGCVLEESLGRVAPVDDVDEGLEDGGHVGLHVTA